MIRLTVFFQFVIAMLLAAPFPSPASEFPPCPVSASLGLSPSPRVMVSSTPTADEISTLEIGETAPYFSLPGIDGESHSLDHFSGSRILAVIFTCNHCPTAQAYEGRIIELVDDYSEKDVSFVAISPNDPEAVRLDELGYTDLSDDFEAMKIRARDRGFNFPYLYDGETQQTSRAYGPAATPHVFIFDGERRLRYSGRIDDSEKIDRVKQRDVRNALDALLERKAVPVAETRTFGCSIKWSDKRESARQALVRWEKEPVTVSVIDDDGVKALLANRSADLLLINFWATWCGPCVAEFPELLTINRMYRNRDFRLITISTDGPGKRDKVLSFLKKQRASFENHIYHSDDVYGLIELVDPQWPGAIPYTILIAPGGGIIYRHLGMIDKPLEVKRAIVEHLGRTY